MSETEGAEPGRQLLSSIERILAEPRVLAAYAEACLQRASVGSPDETITISRAVREVVTHYSNYTAMAGGAAAVPALLPGIGTAVAVGGGALADMGLVLKFEIEMAIVLSRIHGYDVLLDSERQRACLLASISTYDVKSDGNFLLDVAKVESMAIWNYTPRQVSKLLLTVLSRLAIRSASKSLFRAIPFVGVAIGASVNKGLTTRVGERCVRELVRRREAMTAGAYVSTNVRPL